MRSLQPEVDQLGAAMDQLGATMDQRGAPVTEALALSLAHAVKTPVADEEDAEIVASLPSILRRQRYFSFDPDR
jgi:hypothetical protein